MSSIKDIARVARVSHSTVSRALRNSPLVTAETRELIHKIAAQQGYSVSAAARSLVTGRTNTIGVVVTSISNPFVGEIIAGVEEFALAHGYSILLSTSQSDPAREMRAVRSLHEHRVDGILVNSSRVGRLYMPMLAEMKVPIVLINNEQPGEFRHSVSIDNLRAGRDATRHLVELGHTRIGYVGNQFGLQADTDRFSGYRQVIDEADIGFAPELVVHGDGGPEAGMRATARLLALPAPPTAVFCFNDMQALGALRAAREKGLSVPGGLSVIGLDDLYLTSYTDPPLTTVQQPKAEMGRLAAQILLELLAGKNPESRLTLAGKLVVRESTAAPRAATKR
jgi:DNA-binding LacI/PurR family transcriptional regulator